jgi:hypothetical protein
MSNKTPPLVIPVVIDGTGVNRGLNNVNSRLRKGVSGGASGGGFGSGGGDALAVAAAAGIGAGIGAGSGSGGRPSGSTTPPIKARGLGPLMGVKPRFAGGGAGAGTTYANLVAAASERISFRGSDPRFAALNESRRLIEEGRQEALQRYRQRRGELYSAYRTNTIRRNLGIKSMSQSFREVGGARGLAGALGMGLMSLKGASIAGLSVGAAATGAARFLGNIPQIADPESVVGSPFYGNLRQATIRGAQQTPRLGIGQGMIAGSRIASGGRPSAMERHGEMFNKGLEDIGISLGLMYEYMFGDRSYFRMVKSLRQLGN